MLLGSRAPLVFSFGLGGGEEPHLFRVGAAFHVAGEGGGRVEREHMTFVGNLSKVSGCPKKRCGKK